MGVFVSPAVLKLGVSKSQYYLLETFVFCSKTPVLLKRQEPLSPSDQIKPRLDYYRSKQGGDEHGRHAEQKISADDQQSKGQAVRPRRTLGQTGPAEICYLLVHVR